MLTVALKRFCSKPGCKSLTEEKFCENHQYLVQEQKAERNRYYDKHRRDQQAKRFYNSDEWEAARLDRLTKDNGLCQDCLKEKKITMADMVHHEYPIRTHWHLRLDTSKMRSLCNSCHARIDHCKLGG